MNGSEIEAVSNWSQVGIASVILTFVGWIVWLVRRTKLTIQSRKITEIEGERNLARAELKGEQDRLAVLETRLELSEQRAESAIQREREANDRLLQKLEELISETRNTARAVSRSGCE